MKKIEKEFTKYDDKFVQLKRDGNICLYIRTDGVTNKTVCYEVIILNISDRNIKIKGNIILNVGDETYPGSEQWGSKGFTYINYDRAITKYNSLINKG